MLLYNARMMLPNGIVEGYVEFDENTGIITKVGKGAAGVGSWDVDCKGALLLPGAIDVHVHFRQPGGEHKEDFASGSAGAIAGGVTTVLDMPNNTPATDSMARLEAKHALIAPLARCDYGLYMGAGKANEAETAAAAKNPMAIGLKMYMGSSTGDLLVDTVEGAFGQFAAFDCDKPVVVHAEDEESIKLFGARAKNSGDMQHNHARPAFAAPAALARALEIAASNGRRMHAAHASTQAEISLVAIAKQRGVRATCEVCPHHLFLNEIDQQNLGSLGKMNPPLREKADVAALWEGLAGGAVDVVATDHAPHTIEEKNKGFFEAPSGVPGVQTMMPLMLDAVDKGRVTLERVVAATSANPARIFGLKHKGAIAPGLHADFAIWEKNRWTIRGDALESKCGWTPFEGMAVSHRLSKAFLRGKLAYDDGVVSKPGAGRRV